MILQGSISSQPRLTVSTKINPDGDFNMRLSYYDIYDYFRGSIIHPQWLSDRFHISSRKKFLNEVDQSLILDIGSGNSSNKSLLKKTNIIYRLDYPDTNKLYSARPDIYGDACHLPIANESIDVVFLFEVLEHVACDEQAMQEIHRVLKPGGRIYISVPFIYPIHDKPNDYRRFTIYGLRFLLEKNRFVPKVEMRHGNSFISALQLMNMALLNTGKGLWKRGILPGLIYILIAYPLCLLNNLIGLPLIFLRGNDAACFGYFVIADRR